MLRPRAGLRDIARAVIATHIARTEKRLRNWRREPERRAELERRRFVSLCRERREAMATLRAIEQRRRDGE